MQILVLKIQQLQGAAIAMTPHFFFQVYIGGERDKCGWERRKRRWKIFNVVNIQDDFFNILTLIKKRWEFDYIYKNNLVTDEYI